MINALRQLARNAAMPILYWSGAGAAYSLARPSAGAVILMYHSVADAGTADAIDPANRIDVTLFERQMAFLARHRRVIALSELVRQLNAGETPAPGTVCLTFDDGYLDNLRVAAPILARHGLPATLYLATGYVERGESQWADVLHWQFNRRTQNALDLTAWGAGRFNLLHSTARQAARHTLHRLLLEADYPQRSACLRELAHQLQPHGEMPRLTLNWDEARELRQRYPQFEIGGHTRNHLDLRTHDTALAQAEIEGCRDDLRRELGLAPGHFSFPYGRACAATRAMVREAGWQSTIASGHRVRIDAHSHPHGLSRGDTPGTLTELRFMTSSAYPGLYPEWHLGRSTHA